MKGLDRRSLAQRVAREIPDGAYIDFEIGAAVAGRGLSAG
jgi:hypothetical protein